MTYIDGISLAALVAVLAFLWKLHMDVGVLGERLARIEGWIEGRFARPDGGAE